MEPEKSEKIIMTSENIKPGIYEYFKGKCYKVLGVARHSETLEEMVLYEHLDDGSLWVRPAPMFLEEVEREGKKVPRFKFIK
ncbi:MAG: DUF1653 domain-containing protein [Candidatus Komeilibacteria bacterium]|nr:DUF1653 domain-containing protein [Candidatus Komeilibacteria bacterium]